MPIRAAASRPVVSSFRLTWVIAGAAAVFSAGAPTRLCAQRDRRVDPSAAELAIATGRLDIAEAALFEEIRRAPRAPTARGALGTYLAARGKFQVGITLLEEAIQFGGDSAQIEARLLEVFRWTTQYDRAAILMNARLAPEAREAMRRSVGTTPGGALSSTVPLLPNEAFGLGRVWIVIGTERIEADVQPLLTGIQLPATLALFGAVEPVGARGDTTYAVARTIAIGGTLFGPVPVTLVPSLGTARIGLDVLAQLTPTFDFAAKTLTVGALRLAPPRAERWPLLLTFPGVSFVAAEGTAPVLLHSPAGRSAIRGTRWTLDPGTGSIIVER